MQTLEFSIRKIIKCFSQERRPNLNKLLSRITCLILSVVVASSMSLPVFAAERDNMTASVTDPYTITSHYVEDLVTLSQEEIKALPIDSARDLFEEAFLVPSTSYSDEEVMLALEGLGFGLKFEQAMQEAKATTEYEPCVPIGSSFAQPNSITSGVSYSGGVGVAWVRDTTSGHSPLTLGEILSGTYTLEVDYITWDTAASVLTGSASYNAYSSLASQVAAGAGGAALAAYICSVLGISGGPATVVSTAVSIAVGWGWDWLSKIDRSRMKTCFDGMSKAKTQYMKVQFMWSSNMVNKFYSVVTKTSTISNPFPGTYGNWYKNKYGYLYSY